MDALCGAAQSARLFGYFSVSNRIVEGIVGAIADRIFFAPPIYIHPPLSLACRCFGAIAIILLDIRVGQPTHLHAKPVTVFADMQKPITGLRVSVE
ncbi:MAG: hypothetical protein ACLPTZ_00935 [Beijerinckiaceae bacterium]